MSTARKRDRRKSAHDALRDKMKEVLSTPEALTELAYRDWWWNGDDRDDGDWHLENVRTLLKHLLEITQPVPDGRGRGRPPTVTDTQWQILEYASTWANREGKAAANGARGRNITNQGGPFVRDAARDLGLTENQVIDHIDKFERSMDPQIQALWESRRRPIKDVFEAYLRPLK
jgi:hypothetical protein